MIGRERQTAIYLRGVSGRRPRVPLDPERLEAAARARRCAPTRFAYVEAGAGTEDTVRENRAAFARHRIVPRMLRGVERPDASVELFGRRLDSPFLLAPVGVLELAHREADVAVARAARATGVPMIFSNQASRPMEECAEALGDSPRWFQLYWSTSDELVESLVGRAEACGCEAIVLTLDTTTVGWRPRDLEPAFLPFLRGQGIAQYTSDPVFRRLMAAGPSRRRAAAAAARRRRRCARCSRSRAPIPARSGATSQSGDGRAAVQRFTEIFSRPSLSWDDLPFLRERTKLPILLKGILHPDDARRALDAGVDGIVVSNHGGRQVDGAIATLDALPAVAAAVDGRVPVLLDCGVRGGADAFKALALGASAVLIGRAYVYGPRGRRRGGRQGGARQPARRARPDDGAGRLRLARRGRPRDARASRLVGAGSPCWRSPRRCWPAAARSPSRRRRRRPPSGARSTSRAPRRARPTRAPPRATARRRDGVHDARRARVLRPRRAGRRATSRCARRRQRRRAVEVARRRRLPRPRAQARARREPLRAPGPRGGPAALEGRRRDHAPVGR